GTGISSQFVKTCEVYNPLTDKWSMISSMQHFRTLATAVSINNRIYVFGGFNNAGGFLSSCECYDTKTISRTSTSTWKSIMNMPNGRSSSQAIVLNDECIGVISGSLSIGHRGNTQTVLIYNIRTNKWSKAVWQLPVALRSDENGFSAHM